MARAQRKSIADSTLRTSQAVPHPSTIRALSCLTSEVRRDPVHSTRYGRQRTLCLQAPELLPPFSTWGCFVHTMAQHHGHRSHFGSRYTLGLLRLRKPFCFPTPPFRLHPFPHCVPRYLPSTAQDAYVQRDFSGAVPKYLGYTFCLARFWCDHAVEFVYAVICLMRVLAAYPGVHLPMLCHGWPLQVRGSE